jgi:hypothetical protein
VLSPPITRSSIRINEHRGEEHETLGSEGRPYTQEDVDAYKKAKTQLGLGDWMRSSEIASFFFKHGFALPDQNDSIVLDDALDYQDVKLKIVQQEGYDAHDFNLFDDRSSALWRKPYTDGAVRELTRSLSPAATYTSRARARRPGPAGQSFPARDGSPLSSLPPAVSLFFQPLSTVRNSAPESAVRSPAVRNSAPRVRTQRKFRTQSAPCFAFWMGYWEPGRDQARCSVWSGQYAQGSKHGKKLQRSRFCRTLYYSQQVRSSSTLYLLD